MDEKVITAIRVQKHDPGRLNIELDGEFAFGLSRMTAAWLKVGDRISESRAADLQKSDASESAYQKATRLLDYRPRTEMEIRQKLQQKGFETEEIETVVRRLKNANLVADEQFAKMWIENRNESHPRSRRMIRYELKNKGISEQIIDNALTESEQDSELAMKAASRYARRLNSVDRQAFQKRLSAYLARRGFSYGTIAPVVRDLINKVENGQGLNLDYEDNDNG